MENSKDIQIQQKILNSIYFVRDQKVMMDSELAELYGVETKRLNEQVKRNIDRFPSDFMFQLNPKEWADLKSRFAASGPSWGGRRTAPYMFTEQGVAMLSSVLNSPTAIQVNISIMRIFVKMRQWASNYEDLLKKINDLNRSQSDMGQEIDHIYQIIQELVSPPVTQRKPIGYKKGKK